MLATDDTFPSGEWWIKKIKKKEKKKEEEGKGKKMNMKRKEGRKGKKRKSFLIISEGTWLQYMTRVHFRHDDLTTTSIKDEQWLWLKTLKTSGWRWTLQPWPGWLWNLHRHWRLIITVSQTLWVDMNLNFDTEDLTGPNDVWTLSTFLLTGNADTVACCWDFSFFPPLFLCFLHEVSNSEPDTCWSALSGTRVAH